MAWDYARLKRLVRGEPLPAMLVDLDVLDANVRRLGQVAQRHGKRLRVASKSVRVPHLLQRILEVGGDTFQGLMCFSVQEASFLAVQGFDDLLVAYPTVQAGDLDAALHMTREGVEVTLMLDSVEHVERIEEFCLARPDAAGHRLQVCIDVDMSYRPAGAHLGVQRSPIRSIEGFAEVARRILHSRHLELRGVMGYEAQIAGLGDDSPFAPLLNPAKRLIKSRSVRDVARKREELARWLDREDVVLPIFNGGGTGSIETTTQEPWITEVTAGSGFLQSHLFDYYRANRNDPAFCFALQVTRRPEPVMITCHSGGFIASGEVGPDRQPVVFLPEGLEPTRTEGFGEVQTPLKCPASLGLAPGDPVFFRPAKAGEIAERFGEYLLVERGEVVARARTYRGLGQTFF